MLVDIEAANINQHNIINRFVAITGLVAGLVQWTIDSLKNINMLMKLLDVF